MIQNKLQAVLNKRFFPFNDPDIKEYNWHLQHIYIKQLLHHMGLY